MNSQQKQKPAKRPEANIHGLVKEISDAVCQDNSFALDAGRKLYHYQNGVYKPNGDAIVKRLVKRYSVATYQDKHWHRSLNSDVIEFISIDAPTLADTPPSDVLNVANGLLRIRDRKLLPHSPGHLSATQDAPAHAQKGNEGFTKSMG